MSIKNIVYFELLSVLITGQGVVSSLPALAQERTSNIEDMNSKSQDESIFVPLPAVELKHIKVLRVDLLLL